MSVNGIGSGAAGYEVRQQERAGRRDAARKAPAEYDQAAYVRDLNNRLDAAVVPGAWNGKDPFGKDGATAMIHPDFLRKMHDDPALGAEYEAKINDWAKTDADIRRRMEAQGHTITALGMSVDKDGNENYFMAGISRREGPGGKAGTSESAQGKSAKELREELLERLEKERREEKLEEKRAAEAEALGKLASSSSSASSTVAAAVDTLA